MGFFDNKPQIQQGFSTPNMKAADEAVQGIGGRLQPTSTGKQSFFAKMKDRWNAIPQEKKSAFAQQMSESVQQEPQQMASINYIPQDYSWVFQPTRGSMFYGN